MTFLKLFGMLTMLADHTGFLFDIQWLRIIGRACFPVFAFMTAYGWPKTKNKWNYVSRMMELALFSEVPFLWMYELSGGINVSDANTQFALICSMISAGLLLWGGKPRRFCIYPCAAAVCQRRKPFSYSIGRSRL